MFGHYCKRSSLFKNPFDGVYLFGLFWENIVGIELLNLLTDQVTTTSTTREQHNFVIAQDSWKTVILAHMYTEYIKYCPLRVNKYTTLGKLIPTFKSIGLNRDKCFLIILILTLQTYVCTFLFWRPSLSRADSSFDPFAFSGAGEASSPPPTSATGRILKIEALINMHRIFHPFHWRAD